MSRFFLEQNNRIFQALSEVAGSPDPTLTQESVRAMGLDPHGDRLFLLHLLEVYGYDTLLVSEQLCCSWETTDGVKLQVLHYWILEQCETSDPHPCPTTCFNWFVVNPPPCWFCLTKMEASGWRVPIKDAKYSTCTQFEMSVWRFSLTTTKLQQEHTCSLVYSVWYGPTLPRHRCSANTSSCEHSFLSPNLTFDDRQHAKCVNEFIRLLASWMLHESTALVFAASVVGAPTADSFHRFTQAQT